jgi:hypothetical protein
MLTRFFRPEKSLKLVSDLRGAKIDEPIMSVEGLDLLRSFGCSFGQRRKLAF